MREQVRDFPKCREGLAEAYAFANPCDEWAIWFGDELVDDSYCTLAPNGV